MRNRVSLGPAPELAQHAAVSRPRHGTSLRASNNVSGRVEDVSCHRRADVSSKPAERGLKGTRVRALQTASLTGPRVGVLIASFSRSPSTRRRALLSRDEWFEGEIEASQRDVAGATHRLASAQETQEASSRRQRTTSAPPPQEDQETPLGQFPTGRGSTALAEKRVAAGRGVRNVVRSSSAGGTAQAELFRHAARDRPSAEAGSTRALSGSCDRRTRPGLLFRREESDGLRHDAEEVHRTAVSVVGSTAGRHDADVRQLHAVQSAGYHLLQTVEDPQRGAPRMRPSQICRSAVQVAKKLVELGQRGVTNFRGKTAGVVRAHNAQVAADERAEKNAIKAAIRYVIRVSCAFFSRDPVPVRRGFR